MVRKKVPALLVVMSIVLMVLGVITLLIGVFGVLTGGALIGFGIESDSGVVAAIGIAVVILSCIAGLLQLLMGIFGLRGQHLTFCLVMAIIVVVLAVSQLFMGGILSMQILSLVISALYLLGVIAAIQQEGSR